MKAQFVAVALGTALSVVGLSSLPSFAAKSPAMEACSKQWDDMKAAGKTEGKDMALLLESMQQGLRR